MSLTRVSRPTGPVNAHYGLRERLDAFRRDAVFAARSLLRSPGLSLSIVLTLALGLGANGAVFSIINAVFLRPPPGVARPEALRRLWWQRQYRDGTRFSPALSYPNYVAIAEAFSGRAKAAIYTPPGEFRVSVNSVVSPAQRSYATASFFGLLGVRTAIGRLYDASEERLGQPAYVAVISDGYWKRAFGGDPAVIGRSLIIDRETFVVVGVTAAPFAGIDVGTADIWTPVSTLPSNPQGAPWWTQNRRTAFQVIAQKNDGVDDAQLNARATAVLLRPDMSVGKVDPTRVARLGSIIAARGPGQVDQEIALAERVDAVALIVLLIACANVINLLLIRAVRRKREIAVRLSLGISRAGLARLLVTESTMLAAAAGFVALLVAYWGGSILRTELLPGVLWSAPPVDWRVALFSLAAAGVAGIVTGIIPAIQSTTPNLVEGLKSGGREGATHASRTRHGLVIVQASLSVVLLVGAALFVRSLGNVHDLDLGFAKADLLFVRPRFESGDQLRDSMLAPRFAELESRLRTIPGVQSTALTAMRPMSGYSTTAYFPDGVDTAAHKKPAGMFWVVSPNFFQTAGTRLVSGADFTDAAGPDGPSTVIVNEAMARALWGRDNPIGKCVRFDWVDAPCSTVIGIVKTARLANLIEAPTPQFYLPLTKPMVEGRWPASEIAIRVHDGSAEAVSRAARTMLLQAFPGATPSIVSMADVFQPQYHPWQLGAELFSAFGVLAMIVAAVGIYGTVSYGVAQRMHEFGVRVALGAKGNDLIALVVAGGVRVAAIGVAAGVVLALAAGRFIASLLYGIAPTDATTIAAVACLLLLVAVAAAFVPAYRAARVDPMLALRAD
jgi:predicted permease